MRTLIIARRCIRPAGVWAAIALTTAVLPQSVRAQSAAVPLTLSGELRARTEWDRPGGSLDADLFTYLRTRIGLQATPADRVAVFIQLQDSRVYGKAAASARVFDMHQGYVDLSATSKRVRVTARTGRQEMPIGNQRLVGTVNWSNTGQTFDAARILFSPQGGEASWTATAFVATVDERGRRFGTPSTNPEQTSVDRSVAGAFVSRMTSVGSLDATALYDIAANYRNYSGSDRVTVDVRFRSSDSARIGVEIEGAYQAGRQRVATTAAAPLGMQDVGAWLLGVRAGAFPRTGRRTSAVVGADILSGDATPGDTRYSAFSTMYATNHSRYGLMDLFGDPSSRTREGGLVDLLGMIDTEIGPRTGLHAELHRFAAQAGATQEIGWELDITAPIQLSPAATLELGYGIFRAGPAAAAIGLGASGERRHWAYAMLRTSF